MTACGRTSRAASNSRGATGATESHRRLATLFDRVWQQDGQVVAVKPHAAFVRYFTAASERVTVSERAETRLEKRGDNSGSDGTRTRDCHPIEIRL